MKIFSTEVKRRQVVKLLIGIGALAFMVRIVMGLTNQYNLAGVSVSGFNELFFDTLALSSVLLLWDIRDSRVK